MATVDREAPVRFLHVGFQPDDWVAVLVKSHETGRALQRVGPLSLMSSPRFQAWLRFQNASGCSVYVSVNAIEPGCRSRTRQAIGAIRHLFLDVDRRGDDVRAAVAIRADLPAPSCMVHSSPGRCHILWRTHGFDRASTEAVQRRLAEELGADEAATACTQMTRLPGFLNYKRRPGRLVTAEYGDVERVYTPEEFPRGRPSVLHAQPGAGGRAATDRTATDRARRYLAALPPAIAGQRGDAHTFRVCCRLVRGFALEDEEALALLSDWNARCVPPWSERDLLAKVRRARRYGREPFGGRLLTTSRARWHPIARTPDTTM
jgi:hypothetical protein